MPAYTQPDFNVQFSVWQFGHTPAVDPLDFQCFGQLYLSSKGLLDITPNNPDDWVPPIYMRINPPDLALFNLPCVGSIVGVFDTFAFEWYYKLRWWERIHAGFPNEYIAFIAEQCSSAGVCPDPEIGRAHV